jgi:transcriptional regulator NrdR family protein
MANVPLDQCPKCHQRAAYVTDTRVKEGGLRSRKKRCENCLHRWGTFELRDDEYLELLRVKKEAAVIVSHLEKLQKLLH